MPRLAALVLLLAAASASAQTAVAPGETVRVTLTPAPGVPLSARTLLVGRVAQVSPDSLGLVGDIGATVVAWADVAGVERRAESRRGESLGMLGGLVVGGLAGAALGPVITGDGLGVVLALPGALVGLLVGGVVGAHSGETWRPVTGR